MSNEQVVLNMVINRLKQLLELNESLRTVWSAEITEIILLGEGVLTPTPERRDIQAIDENGMWLLRLENDQLTAIYEMICADGPSIWDYPRTFRNALSERINDLYDNIREDRYEGDDNPDPDDDDVPELVAEMLPPGAPEPLWIPPADIFRPGNQ
jgi:hypothetical protein